MPFDLSDYEPVEDRLGKFWADHPDGRVLTELVHVGEDGYIVKASVWREHIITPSDVGPTATGYAAERVTDRGVNATSALENCETSAIGRALANMGYAPKGRRPSREEMTKATSGRRSGVLPPDVASVARHPAAEAEPSAPRSRAGSGDSAVAGSEVQGEGAEDPAAGADRDEAWRELTHFAGGSRTRARSMVNKHAKANYTANDEDQIPLDLLLATVKEYAT